MADVLTELVGPVGALVATATAAGVLWRRHVKDDDDRAKVRDANLEYERGRTRAAEERLDALGPTLKAATDVMEKAVQTTDRVVELLNGGEESAEARPGRPRHAR